MLSQSADVILNLYLSTARINLMHCNDVPQIRLVSVFLGAQPKMVWHPEVQIQSFSRLSTIVDRTMEKRSTRMGNSSK